MLGSARPRKEPAVQHGEEKKPCCNRTADYDEKGWPEKRSHVSRGVGVRWISKIESREDGHTRTRDEGCEAHRAERTSASPRLAVSKHAETGGSKERN